MIEAVVRIGGSLIEYPEALRTLCSRLSKLTKKHRFIITPGGSIFADLIRGLDSKFHLSPVSTHMMAILAVDQYGLFLSNFFHSAKICMDLAKAERFVEKGFTTIFLPSQFIFKKNPFEASWDVTSDSISGYVASHLQAQKLLLIKDVDGIFTKDPKNNSDANLFLEVDAKTLGNNREKFCIDSHLPNLLAPFRLECYVVSGLFPERISRILEGKPTICTRIKS